MATDMQIRVSPARYGGFEATFNWNGEPYRVFFDNTYTLACELASECVDDQTIEDVIDCFERLEWADTDYPLFQPAEAVCDFGDCDCDMCVRGHNAVLVDEQLSDLRSVVRSQWWFTGAALMLIGIVAWFV